MNLLETPYILSVQTLQKPFSPDEYIIAGGVLICAIGAYLLLPIITDAYDAMIAKKNKIIKKQALNDLIMMKEIQSEIDEEMKQAMIRTALREKAAA